MKHFWSTPFHFVIFFLTIFTTISGQKSEIRKLFEDAKNQGFSGTLLVAQDGKIIFHQAAGMRKFENKTVLKKTDIFEFASVSKQFTAMIIMMLKEKGSLHYDDPVSQYIEIPYPNITIRHLLTHTSGLPDYQEIMDKHWDKSKIAGNPEILEYLNRYAPPALFVPGAKYDYSNTGYVLLASIAEKASGEDFISLCRKWIFGPLKMKDTDIRSLEVKARVKNFAAGHLLDSTQHYVNANKFRSSDYTVWLGNRKGPGRISGTARDLLRWDKALYTNKLVSANTIDEAFAPAVLIDGTLSDYGFGWMLGKKSDGKRFVMHTGDNPGYRTIIIRLIDERKTIIILNNNSHSSMKTLLEAL